MSFKEFWSAYYGKRVRVSVIDVNNNKYTGPINSYSPAIDNVENEDSIGITTDEAKKRGVELFSSEIKEVNII